MARQKTPHTAVFRGKRVRVKLKWGEVFVDRFHDRNHKQVLFASGRKVNKGDIVSFSFYKAATPD